MESRACIPRVSDLPRRDFAKRTGLNCCVFSKSYLHSVHVSHFHSIQIVSNLRAHNACTSFQYSLGSISIGRSTRAQSC
jgi:hypothetical protein